MEDDWNTAQHQTLGGPTFLDTIPEDKSVVAARVANLSTASAVASSDSDGPSPKSPRSSAGVSETPALLEAGGDITITEQAPRSPSSTTCTRRTYLFYMIMSLLMVGIAIGIYFIIGSVSGESSEANNPDDNNKTSSSTPISSPSSFGSTFPPYAFIIDSEFPTASPSFNSEDRKDIDSALLEVSASNSIYNAEISQGKCRHWLTHVDFLQLRVDVVGAKRIQQRYVLCVLYYTTKGESWNIPFLDSQLHECYWEGIFCDNEDQVAVMELFEKNLVGSLPDEMIYLKDLQALRMDGNALQGTIPQDLFSSLTKLFQCDLSENQLTGTIPKSSSKALVILNLNDNQLQGFLPWFQNLERLWIQQNLLTGMDHAYATMNTLTSLIVYDNVISGPIPEAWNAPQLVYLDLASNPWTPGTIPESIWELPALESLGLNDCQLTGTLPTSTSRPTGDNFRHVWLHSNRLSGSIPPNLGWNWRNLTTLLLYDNLLTGIVSKDQCSQWDALEQLETDCDLETVECECCTECHGIE